MLELSEILSRCTNEQLESIMDEANALMQHFKFITAKSSTYLAGESEEFGTLLHYAKCLCRSRRTRTRQKAKSKRATCNAIVR